ncbi:MAG: nucleotide exchange factor GrpE [Chitinophagaceae bacterium]
MQENDIVENTPETIEANVNTDENAVNNNTLDEVVAENELDKLKADLEEQKDKYLRLMAEFENYKRRTAKERMELIQTAGKDVIVSMLDVLDDVDRAEKQLQNNDDITVQKEGIQLVFNKIRTTLFSKGVKALDSVNTNFDVEKHEAITEIPAPNSKLKGMVLDEVQKGYYLNDKLIRFAKVVVGN